MSQTHGSNMNKLKKYLRRDNLHNNFAENSKPKTLWEIA
jgi:hypothetical protein